MDFAEVSKASRPMPLAIEPMSRAPSRADQAKPCPPNSDVPARPDPAMASSSVSLPAKSG